MAVNASGEPLGTLVGPWRVVQFIGSGSMGAVYAVEHTTLRSRAAVKFLHAHLVTDAASIARFEAEARAVSHLSHPNIVSVFDVGALPGGRPWFVMEHLEGRTLESVLAQEDFSLWRVAHVVTQLAAGLDHAHRRGVVHRDLKPANVMVMQVGREDFVKLVDFGIAKVLTPEAGRLTAPHAVLGTPDYMAPEQILGGPVDARTDVYALGAITWELLAGRAPFSRHSLSEVMTAHLKERAASPSTLRSSVPEQVSMVVLKALEKAPAARFASAMAFADLLQEAIGVYGAARATPLPMAPPTQKRTRAAVLVVDGAQHQVSREHETADGCFIVTGEAVPLLSDVVLMTEELGPVRARVVRAVSQAQALQWRHPRGLFLEFVGLNARQRALLDGPAHADEVAAEEFLERIRARLWGDAYCALGISPAADTATIQQAAARLDEALRSWTKRHVSQRRTSELRNARARVKEFSEVLLDARRRALYDADRANWRGVQSGLADGLKREDVELLRTSWLRARPEAELRARQMRDVSREHLVNRRLEQSLAAMDGALEADPLNALLHDLRRALVQAAGASDMG